MTPSFRHRPWTFLFDFDSTLVSVETVDELVRLALEGAEPSRAEGVLAEVHHITDLGMEGAMPLSESFARRLAAASIRREHVEAFGREIIPRITPGLAPLLGEIRSAGHDVRILSGGFLDCIAPVADALGINSDHVHANVLRFRDGVASAVEGDLIVSDGKTRAIRGLKSSGAIVGDACMVGDGSTDLAALAPGAADMFIGFGVHVVRPTVRDTCETYCTDLATFRAALSPFLL